MKLVAKKNDGQMILRVIFFAALCWLSVPEWATADMTLDQSFEIVSDSVVRVRTADTTGTGFVVSVNRENTSAGSYIVTADHVVKNGFAYVFSINNPIPYVAKVINEDRSHDLAMLFVPGLVLPPLPIADDVSEGMHVGLTGFSPFAEHEIIASNELRPSVRDGIISSVREFGDVIEHTAVSQPGFSGGPIFLASSAAVVGVDRGRYAESTLDVESSAAYLSIGQRPLSNFIFDTRSHNALGHPFVIPSYDLALHEHRLPLASNAGNVLFLLAEASEIPKTIQESTSKVIAEAVRQSLPKGDPESTLTQATIDPPRGSIFVAWSTVEAQCAKYQAIAVYVLQPHAESTQRYLWLQLWSCSGAPVVFENIADDCGDCTNADEKAVLDGLGREVIAALQARSQTRLDSLIKYGFYMSRLDAYDGFFWSATCSARSATACAQKNAPATFKVVGVDEKTCAWDSGIRTGDQILTVNGRNLSKAPLSVLRAEARAWHPYYELTLKRADGSVMRTSKIPWRGLSWYVYGRGCGP